MFLHGITFAPVWAGAIDLAAELAPPGLATVAQSLYSSMFTGAGGALGLALGGWLYDNFGAETMFMSKAILTVIFALVFLIIEVLPHGRRRRPRLRKAPA